MKNRVVIAGGTGFIGQYLQKRFEQDGFDVIIISRSNAVATWDDNQSIISALESATLLINLAGKPINCSFTEKNKRLLISSRVNTTKALGEAILECKDAPKIWFNASGAHIYGTNDEVQHTELSALNNSFFPAIMAQKWEDAFYQFHLKSTRQIALRIPIVLGKGGGVLQPYLMLTKLFLGGRQGSGKQKFSWVHLEDFYQSLLFIRSKESINGPVNICSPQVISNAELMKVLRKKLKIPFGFPAPAWGIKIGAKLIGIEPDLILKGLSVCPEKLIEDGFHFKYATIDTAVEQIVKR